MKPSKTLYWCNKTQSAGLHKCDKVRLAHCIDADENCMKKYSEAEPNKKEIDENIVNTKEEIGVQMKVVYFVFIFFGLILMVIDSILFGPKLPWHEPGIVGVTISSLSFVFYAIHGINELYRASKVV